jgi:hypothetical protein
MALAQLGGAAWGCSSLIDGCDGKLLTGARHNDRVLPVDCCNLPYILTICGWTGGQIFGCSKPLHGAGDVVLAMAGMCEAIVC